MAHIATMMSVTLTLPLASVAAAPEAMHLPGAGGTSGLGLRVLLTGLWLAAKQGMEKTMETIGLWELYTV